MYLKAIELHGFKSFPDKTRIEFDRGMSAVVGPNGSGKSNISDAIRWVLGETRVSQLRSGGKMEDIIFGGSRSRNPMGFAQVTLVLDNSDHTFDYEGDEISVSRKYYRSGDSEYYINGRKVRLRDIQELFMDTGLGRNGYSMVSQGRVSEIVTSKPEGRREIFEEASGIAKFRFRKNEAERKLEAAQRAHHADQAGQYQRQQRRHQDVDSGRAHVVVHGVEGGQPRQDHRHTVRTRGKSRTSRKGEREGKAVPGPRR